MHSETQQWTGFLVVSSQLEERKKKKKENIMLQVIFVSYVWVLLFSYSLLLAKTINLLFSTPEDVTFLQLHGCPHVVIINLHFFNLWILLLTPAKLIFQVMY
jgi:hypothetical protein